MKRIVSVLAVIALLFALLAGCGTAEAENPITEVRILLPNSTGTKAIVEGEAVLTTQLYILSRAYCEKLANLDTENFDAEAYSQLVAEAAEAFRITEAFCASFETHAGVLAEMEESGTVPQAEATYEVLSASAEGTRRSSFGTLAYAAEAKSPAVQYAEELTKTFDEAKNGQKLKAVAEKYGTDVKHAKAMVEQAQAVLEGSAYEDQAAFENKCYEAAVETKAAASILVSGLAIITSGGLAAGGVSAAGIMEAGGLVCGGLQAVIDTGTAVSIHVTHGEGNADTVFYEKADEALAPISTFFAIGGAVQNVKDIRDPEKAAEQVNNAAQAFLTVVGFGRDYVQDGKVLGVSSNMIEGYREIICCAADISDPEAVKQVLTETGVSPEVLEAAENTPSGTPERTEGLGTAADAYIEDFAEVIDPENPMDVETVLEVVDTAFEEYALAEETGSEAVTEDEPEEESEVAEAAGAVTAVEGDPLSAYNVAGIYHFDGLDASIEAVDDTHLTVTDTTYDEVISGEYDEETGVFTADLGGSISWVVTIAFTDTEDGIRGDYENVISGSVASASSAIKEGTEKKAALPASEVAGYYDFMGETSEWAQVITVVDDMHLMVTDAEDEEAVIIGSYDENTGIFSYTEGEEGTDYFASILITFTDTGSGVRGDMVFTVNDMRASLSAMKE